MLLEYRSRCSDSSLEWCPATVLCSSHALCPHVTPADWSDLRKRRLHAFGEPQPLGGLDERDGGINAEGGGLP
jgi:hypothetical protein